MKDESINPIISIIGIYVLMHYFFTLDVLWRYLGDYNLSIVSIISWEDVQFSIASINTKIFKYISALLLVPFILVQFLIIINKQKIGYKVTNKKNSHKLYTTLLITILAIFAVLLFLFESQTSAILFILIIVATFIYYHYRNFYAAILLISVFIFTKVIYDDMLKDVEKLYGNDIKFELNDGKIIQSDSINRLVFFGTKYIILESDSPNVKLYPTDKIVEIEWINKRKTNQTDTIKATL